MNGHTFVATTLQMRHEQLFEIGLWAILDDYYREAVSSFAASLERFYEFATKVFSAHARVESDRFDAAWKIISRQSERQLGAYVYAYLLSERRAPVTLAESSVAVRNDVIHRGRIPSKEQAIAFGDAVLKVIHPALKVLQSKYAEAYFAVTRQEEQVVLQRPELYAVPLVRHSLPMMLRDLDLSANTPQSVASRLTLMTNVYGRPGAGGQRVGRP